MSKDDQQPVREPAPQTCPQCGGEKFFPKILPHPTEDAYCFDKWHEATAEPQSAPMSAEQWFIAHRGERAAWAETEIDVHKFREMLGWMEAYASSMRQKLEQAERERDGLKEALRNLLTVAKDGEPWMDDLDMPRGAIRENLRYRIAEADAALRESEQKAGN